MSTPDQDAEESAEHNASSVDRLIYKTKQQYDGKNTIAFVGQVGAGKTVVAAFVKHTLSTRWVPRSKGKWEAQMVSGHDEMNETIRCMKRGSFPPATMKDNYPRLEINIHRMKGIPAKIEMVLRDMSGEDYSGHLSESADDDTDRQMVNMLKGHGAYLIHATRYVLMIDCEGIDDWDTDKPKAVNAIKKIFELKKRTNRIDSKNRFTDPLAIVFTKADTLPALHAQKSAEELAREYYDLMSSLQASHSGPRAYFKVSAKTTEERPENEGEECREYGEGEEGEDGEEEGEEYEEGEDGEEEGEEYEEGEDGEEEGEEYEEGEEEESADPCRYLAVPLEYSIEEYERLITWLISAR